MQFSETLHVHVLKCFSYNLEKGIGIQHNTLVKKHCRLDTKNAALCTTVVAWS